MADNNRKKYFYKWRHRFKFQISLNIKQYAAQHKHIFYS